MNAIIFDIQRNSYVDGPGIRTTVFFKGCNLNCKWCHNPESQNKSIEMMLYKNLCTGCGKCIDVCLNGQKSCDLCGKCAIFCPKDARRVCGKEYTQDEVLDEVLKDKGFYQSSGGGVTFSGGECMLQIDFLEEILKMCKENGIHTAVDTAGCVPWKSFEKVMPYTDLFLYDVKCFSEELHIGGTGVSNKLILENLKRLSQSFAGEIIIRIPVMEGFNNSLDEMMKIREFLKDIRYKSVELLPYHKMGEHKYAALGKECYTYGSPNDEEMKEYEKIFIDY